jgi:hypothetical protein
VSREPRRVEPLPDPFVLALDHVPMSRLASNTVFLALADQTRAHELVRELQQHAGKVVRIAPSRLFGSCLERIWGAFHLSSDIGLAPLLSSAEFLSLLRNLADDLLGPVDADGGDVLIVDPSPEHANPAAVEAICSVYPDAVVVVDASVAVRLEPGVRHRVVQWDGTARQVIDAVRGRPRIAPTPSQGADPTRWRDRVVVVVGSGRSGTTWLQQLWLAHEDVSGLDHHESWLFHQLRNVWRVVDEGTGFAGWVDRTSVATAARRFADGVFTCSVERFRAGHAKFVIEKSPVHVERLEEIAAVYPDAWVVHLVRDGRDVALSMSKVPFFQVPELGAAAEMWQRSVDAVRENQSAVRRFRDVRYEDLAADPGRVMRSLWEWVGLQETPETTRRLESAVATRVSGHGRTSTDIGSWTALPPGQISEIYRSAGRGLVSEGYATRREVWRARSQRARKASTTSRNS